VLDRATPAPEEDDEPGQETDRADWVNKAGDESVRMAETVLTWINELAPGNALRLKFNKYYIGLQRDGLPNNFMTSRPRRKGLNIEFRIDQSDELTARLEDSGVSTMSCDRKWKRYRISVGTEDLATRRELIGEFIELALGVPASSRSVLPVGVPSAL
jgi:hypothetical protein